MPNLNMKTNCSKTNILSLAVALLIPLEIPFATMPRDRSPATGDTFAFTGSLRGKKDDMLFQEGVEVICCSLRLKKEVTSGFLSLANVTPVTKTK